MPNLSKIYFIVLFIFLSPHLIAQKVQESSEILLGAKTNDVAVVGTMNGKILAWHHNGNAATLYWYSKDMWQLDSLSLDWGDRDLLATDLQIYDDEVIIFFQKSQKKMLYLYGTKVNAAKEQSDVKLLDSIQRSSFAERTRFEFASSPDKKYHLLSIWQSNSSQRELLLSAKLYDVDFNLVNSYMQTFENEESYEMITAAADSEGGIFMLLGEKRYKRKAYERLAVMSKRISDAAPLISAVDLKNYAWSGLKVAQFEKDRNIYLGGLFHKNRFQEAQGIAALVFDMEENKISAQQLIPVMMQNKSVNLNMKDLEVRDFYLRADRGYELVAEKHYVESKVINNMPGMMTTGIGRISQSGGTRTIEEEENYNEIHVFSINPDGSLQWSQTMLKEQKSVGTKSAFSSYGILRHRLGNVFLFNDYTGRNTRLLGGYVSNKGELTLRQMPEGETLFANKNVLIKYAKQVSKDALVAPIVSRGRLSFVKITF